MTDSQLLSRFVSSHDQRAFTELVHRYERLVWTVCGRQLDNHCDVEDAFQTTFMLMATKAHRIRNPDALPNWLFGVAWKTSARIRKTRACEPLDDLELASSDDQPLDAITRKYEIELVDQRLSGLDEKYRTPLILYYFSGLTTRQIAERLEISVSAAEGRLRRARFRLRIELNSQGVLLSPVLLTALMAVEFQANPELVLATSERCITAVSGAVAGAIGTATGSGITSGTLSLGAKLMICKICLSVAITLFLAIGGLFHHGAFQSKETVAQTITLDDQQETSESSGIELKLADDDQKSAHKNELKHKIHVHLHHFHMHVHHLFKWMHGGKSQEEDAHKHHLHKLHQHLQHSHSHEK